MKLQECRELIDEIDSEILALLKRRAALASRIGQLKMRAGIPVVDPDREDIVLSRVVRDSGGEMCESALLRIYREILGESRRIQRAVAEVAKTKETVL
jgi:chorismate mutase